MKFRKHFDYDTEKASNEAAIPADQQGESMTVQAHSVDADINEIMRRFGVTGQLPQSVRVPSYGDFTGVTDYASALMAIQEAQENFLQLDAKVRARFENDPQLFLEFCSNPENIPELVKMGLGAPEKVLERSSQPEAGKVAGSSSPAPTAS